MEKERNIFIKSLLIVVLVLAALPAVAWDTWGSRTGSGYCDDPSGGDYWRSWSYWGNNFNVDLRQKPTRNEYFSVTHPTITNAEPYIEFKVKVNGTWESSYPQTGHDMSIDMYDKNRNKITVAVINQVSDWDDLQNIQWYLSQFNFMPQNINKDYGLVRLVAQEGQITGKMHQFPAGNVTLVLRYYPSEKALRAGVEWIGMNLSFWFEGVLDKARLSLCYLKNVTQNITKRADEATFKVVGPHEVEYTVPKANSYVMPTNTSSNNQQYRTIAYNFPFERKPVYAEKTTTKTGVFKRNDIKNAQDVSYDIKVSEDFLYDRMAEYRGGPVTSCNMSMTFSEPYDVSTTKAPKYVATLSGYPRPTETNAVFKKWGTPRVSLDWGVRDLDDDKRPTDTDGKWYIYRADANWRWSRTSDYTLVGSVDYDKHTFEDRTIEPDKYYMYTVMFGSNKWQEKYWKAESGYLSELASESYIISTNVNLAMGQLRQVRNADPESGIRLAWTSEKIEDSNVYYVIKRKVGDGPWDEQYASVKSSDNNLQYFDADAKSASTPYYYKVAVKTMGKTFETGVLVAYYDVHSSITALRVSTGAYSEKVTVEGTIDRRTTDDTQYVVQRRLLGSGDTEFSTVFTGLTSDSEFRYDDNTAKVGDMYEYRVQLMEKDGSQSYITLNNMTAVGFCRSTGVVAGRVTYGNGVAVEGARVNVIPDGNDKVSRTGQFALHSETVSRGLEWTPSEGSLSADKAITVQMWVKPEMPTEGVCPQIFGMGDIIALYLVPQGNKYMLGTRTDAPLATPDGKGIEVLPNAYTHVTLKVKNNGADGIGYEVASISDTEGDTLRTATGTVSATADSQGRRMSFGGTPSLDARHAFTGCIDDIRVWNRWLSIDDDSDNYDRILGGNELGLMAYWPLDENLDHLVFDYSSQNSVANMNNPTVDMGMRSVEATPQSLCSYGRTDSNGNYIVRGIPYASVGTNYIVRPQLGTHSFSPQHRTAFMTNTTSTASGTDFTDVSSFVVTGDVVYEGTNYPVEGAMLSVDGNPCTVEGTPVTTDAKGHFEISVPIGEHSVSVSLSKHEFVNGGRYPATGLFEFKKSVSGLTFEDATKVVFTGRVTGGNVEGKKPVGFGSSRNTIGEAEITLKASDLYYINAKWNGTRYEASESAVDVASSTDDIKSVAYRGTGVDGAHRIYIHTDPQTGEFSAVVPPLNYTVEKIHIAKNPAIEFTDIPKTIDITKVAMVYTDSLKVEQMPGDSVMLYYPYNLKMLETYLDPASKFIITQVDNDESAQFGAYGMKSYENKNFKIDALWQHDDVGDSVKYVFGYPLFRQGDRYEFLVEAYDEYVNNDGDTPVITRVPQSGVKVTVSNPMSSEQTVIGKSEDSTVSPGAIYQLKENQMLLDKDGKGTIKWRAGFPNITSPYTRTINVYGEFNGRPQSAKSITGVVLGSLPNGNNFITQGPDKIITVLRDPPASASSASLQNDTTVVTERTRAESSAFEHTDEAEMAMGLKTDVIKGFVLMDTSESKNVSYEEGEYESKHNTAHSYTVTTTTSKTVSTSDDSEYVGSNGDVFIGYSTNMLIGDSRNLVIQKDDDSGGYKLVDVDGVVMDQTFSTAFHFTQLEIESKQIPTWERMRNSLLLRHPKVESREAAEKIVNTGKTAMYVTWLDPDDDDFGTDGYICIRPENPIEPVIVDSVNYMNQQINLWKRYLAMNEEDKVNAFKQRNKYFIENLSFDGGASIERSYTTETEVSSTDSWEYTWKFLGGTQLGYAFNKIGFTGKIMFGRETYESTEDRSVNTNSQTCSYTLVDGSAYTDLSLDVFKSPMGWGPIFRVRGGQTLCPWEKEEHTRYYEPDNTSDDHILNYGTQALDRPKIYCDERVRNDVPAGSQATFKVRLVNESQAMLENQYVLKTVDDANPHGAAITVDGLPLNHGITLSFGVGQAIEKTIVVKQTDLGIDRFENLGIALVSACQNDPSSYFGAIGDTLSLSVHYAPTSSDVSLKVPNATMNTATGSKMALTIDGFDRAFKNLYGLRLQYCYGGSTVWSTIHEFVLNPADSTSTTQSIIPKEGAIIYPVDMSDFAVWPDGNYTFRVISVAMNGSEEVVKSSPEIKMVKDLERPKPLGYPTPSNGILSIGDNISVTFNEDIQRGMLTNNNVVVSGVLNEQPVAHGVAVKLTGEPMTTVGEYNLSDSKFTTEMWLYRTSAGELLRHGYGGNMLVASVDDDGHVVVDINGEKLRSDEVLPMNKWTFITAAFDNAVDSRMSMSMAYDTYRKKMFNDVPIPQYKGRSPLVIGNGLKGMVNELTLWNVCRDEEDSFEEMNTTKSANAYGLVGYWKFDEGNGFMAKDATGRNDFFIENSSWYLDNENLSLCLDSGHYAEIPVADISTTSKDSYAVEMWFKAKSDGNDNRTLFHIGAVQKPTLGVSFTDSGETLRVAYGDDKSDFACYRSLFDDAWHHFAINVHRGVSAVCFVDGEIVGTIDDKSMPAFAAATMYVGAAVSYEVDANGNIYGREVSDYLNGAIDAVKMWNASLNGDYITGRRFDRVGDIDRAGLVAYYPFETLQQDEYHQWKASFTLADMSGKGSKAAKANGATSSDDAPPLRSANQRKVLNTSFTASERSIFVNIGNSLAEYDGTTLNIEVSDVRDYNGNVSQPIKWSAYVDQNQLKWALDEVTQNVKVGVGGTIDMYISNVGGETQNYYISNLPTWLDVDNASGNLDAQKVKGVKFTIHDNLAVGVHDQTVYLTGNDGISEPLHIIVKVSAAAPDWSVNPADYSESMNMVAQVYLRNHVVTDNESLLAAFIDGKCVGVGNPKYQRSRDAYFVSMTIYGNEDDTRGKPMELRFWDAETGTTYTMMKTDRDIMFVPSAIIGSFSAPVRVENSTDYEQSISLVNGWNWRSTYLMPVNSDINSVLGTAMGSLTLVKSNSGFAMQQNGALVGSLTEILPKGMYAVKTCEPSSFRIYGSLLSGEKLDISISPGWSWIGSTSPATLSLDEAFVGLSPANGDVVKSQHGFAIYNNLEWEGNLTAIMPGEGYKYCSVVGETRTFRFPTTPKASNMRSPLKVAGESRQHYFTPIAAGKYPDNMSVVAQVRNGAQVVDNLEVAAFVGDVCRATSFAIGDNHYITVPGDADGGEVTFKTVVDGKVMVFPNIIEYRSDAIIGSPDSPLLLNLDKATSVASVEWGRGIHVAPHVTDRYVSIAAELDIASVSIVDIGGHLWKLLRPQSASTKVDMLDMPVGNYILKVTLSDGRSIAAHVVKR